MLDMDQKVKIFKALGNKTRFLIFKNVFTKSYACSVDEAITPLQNEAHEICVSTIASQFDYSLPTISKHLKELKEANIIIMTKRKNTIYIEPNHAVMQEIAECFAKITF